ncbi:hypothetical protein MBANPS3_005613 [Mucor bainieri]
MHLKPTSTHIIPIYLPVLKGKKTQQVLSVDKHVFRGKNNSTSNRKIAFLFNHATGFHKEMLHPVMRRFKDRLRSLKEYQETDITFISWDDRQHGDSARLNEGRQDENHNPTDMAMDTKQLVDTLDLKTRYDFLVGVGHRTFSGLCLIEPVVRATLHDSEYSSSLMMNVVAKRKEEWKDMQELCEVSLSKKFFQDFHPEALSQYANYGVYKTGNGQTVKLKCSRNSEQTLYKNCFFENYLCSVALQKLTDVPTQLVLANKSVFNVRGEVNPYAKLKGSIAIKVVDGTHMLPIEDPDVVVPYLMDLTRRVVIKEEQSLKAML